MKIRYTRGEHIPALDSIRGLAVLLVILFHCYPHNITKIGWIGVDIFFVLSGFLITGILLDTKGKANFYKNFIIRRTLRIFPLYYFALLVCLVIIPAFWPGVMSTDFNFYITNQKWFWLYCQNWLFSLRGFPVDHTLVHFWSLAVEEQFYIFWPLLIMVLNRKQLLYVSILLIAFSAYFKFFLGSRLGFVYPFQYLSTFARMDALLIGAIIAILIRGERAWLEKYAKYFAIISLLIVSIFFIRFRIVFFGELASIYLFIDILAGYLILYMLNTESKFYFLKKFLNASFFRILGKYSYGLYVYHAIILRILENHYYNNLKEHYESSLLAILIIGSITIILSFIISILSFWFIESPLLKLKKYF